MLLQKNPDIKCKTGGASLKMDRHEVGSEEARGSMGQVLLASRPSPGTGINKRQPSPPPLCPSLEIQSQQREHRICQTCLDASPLCTPQPQQRPGVFQYLQYGPVSGFLFPLAAVHGGGWRPPSETEVLS